MLAVFLWSSALQGALPAAAQSFFKVQEEAGAYFDQQVARFPDGDVLTATSSVEAQVTGNGRLFLTRRDHCGVERWSNSYEQTGEYLELKDLLINDQGEIFAYGSTYRGLDERIFLLKLDGNGELMRFQVYQPETVDHFSFSIALRGNRLMAYGLLLGWNTRKQGFVAVFDDGLNYRWGKKFTPFQSQGEAIISRDNGFFCRSGPYLVKLDGDGALQWASSLNEETGQRLVAGPLETADGFVVGMHHAGNSFLYKVDYQGRRQWQTPPFPATRQSLDLSLRPDGALLATYLDPSAGEQRLCYLLVSPQGAILQQRRLAFPTAFQSSTVYQAPGPGQSVTLAGNPDPYGRDPDKAGRFLLQFSLDGSQEDCFSWEPLSPEAPAAPPAAFEALAPELGSLRMERVEAGSFTVTPFDAAWQERCDPAPDGNFVPIDTLLPCGEAWSVALPDPDFRWDDGHPEAIRVLEQPGIYRASNQSCISPVTYEFLLTKTPCESCPAFLPNAFSPNGDGRNDRLAFFSDCTLLEVQCSIYSRYGALVFESRDPTNLWDGSYGRQAAQAGVYLAHLRYQWLAEDGSTREEVLTQDVMLFR